VSRETWNAVQLSRIISHIPDKTDGGDIVSADELKAVLCYPLHVVADCLIDMLAQTEDQLNDLFQVSALILRDYSLFFAFCYWSFVME